MSKFNELLKDIDQLKPIPRIAQEIIGMAENPNSSMADIAEVIAYDPIITAELIKMCNSGFYALRNPVNSIQDAITLLGLEQLIDLVIIKLSGSNFNDVQDGYGLLEGELWRNSVTTAIIAREIARKKKLETGNLIFTGALLKDIGKVVLNRYVKDSYEKIKTMVEKDGMSFREAEKKAIGIDHAELSGIIAKKWNFSKKLIFMIVNHHMADETARNDIETAVIYLADVIAMMMGLCTGLDGLAYRFYNEVLTLLKFNEKDLQEIIIGVTEQIENIDKLLIKS